MVTRIPRWYSCGDLAALRLPGYPKTRQGWDKLVKDAGWPYQEVRGPGKGGVNRKYQLPDDLMLLLVGRTSKQQEEQSTATGANKRAGKEVQISNTRGSAIDIGVDDFGFLSFTPFDVGGAVQAATVSPTSELLVKAFFALMQIAEIPSDLTSEQRVALTMRLFNLLLSSCSGNANSIAKIVNDPDALKAALQFAWVLYRVECDGSVVTSSGVKKDAD